MGEHGASMAGTLVLYFSLLAAVAYYASRRKGDSGGKRPVHGEEAASYFLAERSIGFAAVAASLFSSNIGAEHFVGLAGTAAYSGLSVSFYELGAIPCLLVLGYVFLPVYVGAGVSTVPEWLERRYNGFCRTFVVVLSLFLYIFTKISATLFAGQLILAEVSHLDRWSSAVALIVATAVYTMVGGLSAVVYTEALQTVVLITGGLLLCGAGLVRVGGISGLVSQLEGQVPASYFHILRPATDDEFPWPGMLVGYFCVSLWYWACDQVIVQRAMSATSVLHGRAGCTGAAALKLLPAAIMVLPGMMARALMTSAGAVGPESPRGEYDRAFAWMVMNVVPVHARGLLVAAMASALMSSLSSVFNSAATLFSLDVWQRLRPSAPQSELVWTGRVCVVALAALSAAWLPLVPLLGDQLFLLIQKPASYSGPAVFAVFLWGATTPRVGSHGAAVALVAGVGIGALRFALEVFREVARGGRPYGIPAVDAFAGVNFLHFAILEFVGASAVLLATPGPSERERARATEYLYTPDIFWRMLVDRAAGDGDRSGGRDRLLGGEGADRERSDGYQEEGPCEVEMVVNTGVGGVRPGSRWREPHVDEVGEIENCEERRSGSGRGGATWEKRLQAQSRVVNVASGVVLAAFLAVVGFLH